MVVSDRLLFLVPNALTLHGLSQHRFNLEQCVEARTFAMRNEGPEHASLIMENWRIRVRRILVISWFF